MAVFSVEGKLGTGKTKFCVWMAQKALREGRAVASNVDLYLEHLVPERASSSYSRVPDKPTSDDLYAIGHGNPDSYDEDKNGVLILDELGSWLNTRTFQDKDRAKLIEWLIHARKYGWDVYLIVQDAMMIDKQVREALIEYQCRCVRLDKVRIPIFGSLLGMMHQRLAYMPRVHVVTARVGYTGSQVVAERWTFRGDDLHKAYDTRQIFKHDPEAVTKKIQHAGVTKKKRRGWLVGGTRSGLPVQTPTKARHPLVDLISQLPEAERVKHWLRLASLGAL